MKKRLAINGIFVHYVFSYAIVGVQDKRAGQEGLEK